MPGEIGWVSGRRIRVGDVPVDSGTHYQVQRDQDQRPGPRNQIFDKPFGFTGVRGPVGPSGRLSDPGPLSSSRRKRTLERSREGGEESGS